MRRRLFISLSLCTFVAVCAGCEADEKNNPLADAEQNKQVFDAVVIQRHAAGPYAYHELAPNRLAAPTRWLVTIGGGHPAGTKVTARSFARRQDFHSRRLDRTFAELLFGILTQR